MANVERLAALEPLNAEIMALDTAVKEFQLLEETLRVVYDSRGLPRPIVSFLARNRSTVLAADSMT
jgi:hypothetical protein